MAHVTDVVVVGAGLAGLTAARRLAAAGRDVVVLEARDRVGGRILNHELPDGQVVEVGGQFVGPGQHRILGLAREVGVDTFPVWTEGRQVLLSRGRRLVFRTAPRINPLVLIEVARAAATLSRLARRVPPDRPWDAPRAVDHDRLSVEDWLRRAVWMEQARDVFRLAVRSTLAAEPEDVGFLHLLFLVRSAGGVRALTDVAGGAQEARFVGGSHLIAQRVADDLGDRIRLRTPVRRVRWGSDGVEAATDDGSFAAPRAILAIPPAVTLDVAFEPALPAVRTELLRRMPHGSVIKVNAVYDRPWWRDFDLNGQGASDRGLISATFDNTPPSGRPGVLMGFVEAADAERLRELAPADQRRAVLDGLHHLFGPRVRAVRDVVITDWTSEPWTRGCYGANLGPGVWTSSGRALREPTGPLHWAGTETAERWMLYMDGAVASGERAAREVLGAP